MSIFAAVRTNIVVSDFKSFFLTIGEGMRVIVGDVDTAIERVREVALNSEQMDNWLVENGWMKNWNRHEIR